MNKINTLVIVALFLIVGCTEKSKDGSTLSTTTSGVVKIVVDETLMPIIDAEIQVFETIYPKAHIEVTYLPEADAMAFFLNDSAQLIILPRTLNDAEKAIIKEQKRSFSQNKIATDAIALIINQANTDSTFELAQLREIIRGNFSTWSQVASGNLQGKIDLVFDNQNSSTVKYMAALVGKEKVSGYAVNTNKEVIDYVSENKNALGIIGINWISDKDDSSTVIFKRDIRVVGIKGDPGDLGDDYYYQPYQAYLATKQYALIREVHTVSREARAGLATGFASFIAGDKGQKIILKAGLLPANAPIRIIQTN
jgi:phosphate transport system substrate-binding protein